MSLFSNRMDFNSLAQLRNSKQQMHFYWPLDLTVVDFHTCKLDIPANLLQSFLTKVILFQKVIPKWEMGHLSTNSQAISLWHSHLKQCP